MYVNHIHIYIYICIYTYMYMTRFKTLLVGICEVVCFIICDFGNIDKTITCVQRPSFRWAIFEINWVVCTYVSGNIQHIIYKYTHFISWYTTLDFPFRLIALEALRTFWELIDWYTHVYFVFDIFVWRIADIPRADQLIHSCYISLRFVVFGGLWKLWELIGWYTHVHFSLRFRTF